ncbi:S-adenosyl-L-methionine-dependent methyltransferase [Fusarium tricinctum]|uniref:S-adenosyl-L-methionine-dependent methyltransferase n=1 Tax=Fusarium tricinctum TaxID=61284 RepID=A0A8K0W5J7_9HYPO|nr:S-adenosyl-L-methionine-dependent methyltransferase [Fusarium tricinctum]
MSTSPSDEAARQVPANSTSPGSSKASRPQTDTGLLPPQHWIQLTEEDGARDDTDSTLSDNASSTASLTSSILQYRTLHGRSYQSERGNAHYWGPIDDLQQEAMDIKYGLKFVHLLGLLAKAINKAAVDIGTGTGIEFADMFPNASVVGTDLAPIQPSWIPPNLEFQIDDCTQEWSFEPASLDYVHIRWLVGSIMDWTALFKQAHKSLKPGGYVESYEPGSRVESDDGSVREGSALSQWEKFFVEGGRKLGRPFTIFEEGIQKAAMREAGFVDIEERDFKNPVGGWPEDPKQRSIGQYTQAAFEQDAKGTVLHMATSLGWTEEEITVFVAHFKREIRSPKVHPYYRQKVVWGRKPI